MKKTVLFSLLLTMNVGCGGLDNSKKMQTKLDEQKIQQEQHRNAVQKQEEKHFWAKLCDREPEDGGFPPHPQLPLAANPVAMSVPHFAAAPWQRIQCHCLRLS